MYYTGIGSRETPCTIAAKMSELAYALARRGYTLRSGGAQGADTAFEEGCDIASGKKEIYLPWSRFNGSESMYTAPKDEAFVIAAKYHPAWERCSNAAKKLHARNVHQVLGWDLDSPSMFVVCWTPTNKGGTLQATRIATAYGIPVYNMYTQGSFSLSSLEDHTNMGASG